MTNPTDSMSGVALPVVGDLYPVLIRVLCLLAGMRCSMLGVMCLGMVHYTL